MSRPTLVIADIHGNLPALKAVLSDAAGKFEAIRVLGDVVGYGPEPGECLELLRNLGAVLVAGNHDWGVSGKIDIADFNSDARFAAEIHRGILSDEQKDYLSSLPEKLVETSVSYSHGDPRNPVWGYVLENITATGVLAEATTSLTLIGHSHYPGLWRWDGSRAKDVAFECGKEISYTGGPHLANPGSVGQSRNGDPAARYLIVNSMKKTLEFRKCKWRSSGLKRKMKKAGYPETLIRRMSSGE